VHTSKKQVIKLPVAINLNNPKYADMIIIRAEEVKMIAKRYLKLETSLRKGFTMVYDQGLQEVRDKLELMDDWEKMQKDQSLHELIQKIVQVCVGFDDHKEKVFNLVQVPKTLFLYMQGEKDTVEEFRRNF
jgi:hypothetical protein